MSLKILHIIRAPIGGLFRHVRDLSLEQAKSGHQIGLFAADLPNNDYVNQLFEQVTPHLSLGCLRQSISRLPSFNDKNNMRDIKSFILEHEIDVVHGHGAKGGAYARLLSKNHGSDSLKNTRFFYTPHGGVLHYNPKSPIGFVFLKTEKYFQKYTDGIIFESQSSKNLYEQKIDKLSKPSKVIYNGLVASEFNPIKPNNNAADFLYIGELRKLKGVDCLINAFAKLSRAQAAKTHKKLKLIIVGYGPEEQEFKDMVAKAGIYDLVQFLPPMPARDAFKLAKVQVMPSRAEGLPYMILETIAAKMPLIASNVGGIPEIYGPNQHLLFDHQNIEMLYQFMQNVVEKKSEHIDQVDSLYDYVKQHFNAPKMAQQITQFYQL